MSLLLVVSKERLIIVEAHQTMIYHPAEEKGGKIEGNGKVVRGGGRFNC